MHIWPSLRACILLICLATVTGTGEINSDGIAAAEKSSEGPKAEKADADGADAEPENRADASSTATPVGPVVADEELRARRPDGLRGLAAPLLRGEGNWPSLGLYTSLEARILQGVESLLASVPFWAKVTPFACSIACLLWLSGVAMMEAG